MKKNKWAAGLIAALLAVVPGLADLQGSFLYRLIMITFKLLLLPVVVGITYEINRWCGKHDNWLSAVLSAPGKWLQHMTTNEPDDGMIECAIRAMELVIPEERGSDEWGN